MGIQDRKIQKRIATMIEKRETHFGGTIPRTSWTNFDNRFRASSCYSVIASKGLTSFRMGQTSR